MKRKTRTNMPAFVQPMLAAPVAVLPSGPEWSFEPKLDGYRGQLHKDGEAIRLLSREGKDLGSRFPELLDAGPDIVADQAIVDGEIVAINAAGHISFQALHNRKKFPDYEVVFFAFDLIFENGQDLRTETRCARRERLISVIRSGHPLRLCPELAGEVADVMEAARQCGLEGIVAKRRQSPYRPGTRSDDWRKKRFVHREEFIIGGYQPLGRDSIELLVVGYYDSGRLHYAAKIHAGLVPASRRALRKTLQPLESPQCPFSDLPTKTKGRWGSGITLEKMKTFRWVRPVTVALVEFLEWTPERRLRHPAFLKLES